MGFNLLITKNVEVEYFTANDLVEKFPGHFPGLQNTLALFTPGRQLVNPVLMT